MSITVIKEAEGIRIVRVEGDLPSGREVELFTKEEIQGRRGLSPIEQIQLESIARDEEDDWEEALDALTADK